MINRRKATKKNFIGKSWIYQENDYLCTANFKTVTFMNNYETVFILTPVLSDAQMKEAVDKIKAVLSAENASRWIDGYTIVAPIGIASMILFISWIV